MSTIHVLPMRSKYSNNIIRMQWLDNNFICDSISHRTQHTHTHTLHTAQMADCSSIVSVSMSIEYTWSEWNNFVVLPLQMLNLSLQIYTVQQQQRRRRPSDQQEEHPYNKQTFSKTYNTKNEPLARRMLCIQHVY